MIPLSATSWPVDCAGVRHRIAWRDGTLVAVDHPDPERELALTALGGEAYRCLGLVRTWARHADDLDVLLLASRGPHDSVVASAEERHGPIFHGRRPRRGGVARGHGAGWVSHSHTTRSHFESPDPGELREVLVLGGGLSDRLVAQVVDTWVRRLAEENADSSHASLLPRLRAALHGRFTTAARHWLGEPGARIRLTMVPAGTPVVVERRDGAVHVEMPFAWLGDVALPGFAVVADRLCLAAEQTGPGRYELTTLERDLITRSTTTVTVTVDGTRDHD